MRILPPALAEIIADGPPFIGDRKPQTRITVQSDWWLTASSGPVGNRPSEKLPIRWFQDDLNSQYPASETVIPNVKQVVIDRQLQQAAATIQVTIYNTVTPADGQAGPNPDAFGDPGHFAYARGLSGEGNARWNFSSGAWTNVLRENALLRVYQGYGPDSATLDELLNSGNVILDGVFLVDNVAIEAQTGLITLNGRDMAKLLTDQFAWPPTVPQGMYTSAGIVYFVTGEDGTNTTPAVPGYGNGAWVTTRGQAYDADGVPAGSAGVTAADGPASAVDGNDATYWLSPQYSSPSDVTWIELDCGEEITGVYLNPILPNFQCFVSVMENGAWVHGAGTVDGVPYVSTFGVASGGHWYELPARYTANRVRLSFTNLQHYGPITTNYVAGLITATLGSTGTVTATNRVVLDMVVTPDNLGYRLVGSDGGVFCYGDANFFGSMAGRALNGGIVGIARTTDDNGYWLAGSDGGVFAFGDAPFHGSAANLNLAVPIVAIRATPSGNGYYLCAGDGGIFTYGDAVFHGSVPSGISGVIVDFDVTPTNGGYWMMDQAGKVFTFGDAVHYGDLTTRNPDPVSTYGVEPVAFEATHTGLGYRIAVNGATQEAGALNSGLVYVFGDAQGFQADGGNGVVNGLLPPLNAPISGIRRNSNDTGYWLVAQDGGVFTFGANGFFGSLPGPFITPIQGNYKDYCLDEQSEALTQRGWLRYDEIREGDMVLGQNPEGVGCWHKVESVYRRHRENWPMVRFNGASFDALTTPDHRWLTYFGTQGDMRWTTSDAMTTADRVPLTVPTDHLPKDPVYSDDFVELVAWFWTEGSWKQYGSQLSQSMDADPVSTQRIMDVLNRLYGPPSPSGIREGGGPPDGYRWSLFIRQDGQHLFDLGSWPTRELRAVMGPQKDVNIEFLLSLTAEQLDLFIETSLSADRRHRKDGHMSLSQRVESRIKAFEVACVLAGRPFVTHERSTDGVPAWTVSLLEQDYMAPVGSANQAGGATVTKERYTGTVWCPQTELGNFVARRNGSVYLTGNCDIVSDFLLWSGFWLYPKSTNGVVPAGQAPLVFGNIETTGAFNSIGPIPPDTFDKKQVIDCITAIAQIVGYIFRVDETGAARFQPPNWWASGNYTDYGTYTTVVPVLDEKTNLNDYTQTTSDTATVSEIIVAASDPYLFNGAPPATPGAPNVVTRFTPAGIGNLHGINKPAMIGVPLNVPVSTEDQSVLAELLALQCFFANRQGSAVASHNPAICVDDQIKIYERSTGEANVHYVRGVHIEHDLDSGQKMATYTTYWLGNSDNWAITSGADAFLAGSSETNTQYNTGGFVISETLTNFLANTGSKQTSTLVAQATSTATTKPTPPPASFPTPPSSSGPKTYVVRSGDTLSSIAVEFGLTLAQIEALNPNIPAETGSYNLIFPGMVVNV